MEGVATVEEVRKKALEEIKEATRMYAYNEKNKEKRLEFLEQVLNEIVNELFSN